MTGTLYAGNSSGFARKVQNIYVGNNSGKAREVGDIYVGNNSGKAVRVWPQTVLPSDYQRVEYITSDQSLHGSKDTIKLNIILDTNTRVVVDYSLFGDIPEPDHSSDLGEHIFLGYDRGDPNHNEDSYIYSLSNSRFTSKLTTNTNGISTTTYTYYYYVYFMIGIDRADHQGRVTLLSQKNSDSELRKRHVVDMNRSNGTVYFDNKLIYTFTNVFTMRDRETTLTRLCPTIYKIYGIKIYYKTNTLLFDGYPCYNKDTFETGIYDIVSDQFFGGENGYGFYTGPDVNE